MPLNCTVDGNDYSEYLVGLDLEAPERGGVGTATLYFTKLSGGLTITSASHVKVWRTDGGGTITHRYFGGFAVGRLTTSLAREKTWELPCVDYNIELDVLWSDKQDSEAITLAADTFAHQVDDLVTQLTTGAAAGIDSVSGVADLYATMPERTFATGMSLRGMLQELCDYAQEQTPALRPGFHIGYTSSGGVFGSPELKVYDRAATPSPAAQFSNVAADIALGYKKYLGDPGDFARQQDRTTQVTRRQAYRFDGNTTGLVRTYAESAAITAYPNPFSSTGSWMAEPIEYNDAANTTELLAYITRNVQALAYPRDTITWFTNEALRPGQYVTHSVDFEGLDDYLQQISAISYDFSDPINDYLHVTSGPPILEFGENGEDDVVSPPPEGDHEAPPPPTIALYQNGLDRIPGYVRVTITPPSVNDYAYAKAVVNQQDRTYYYEPIYGVDWEAQLQPYLPTTIQMWSRDTSGNYSETGSNTLSFNAESPVPTDTLQNGDFAAASRENPDLPDLWQELQLVGSATAARSTSHVLEGIRSFALGTTASTGSIAEYRSGPVKVKKPANSDLAAASYMQVEANYHALTAHGTLTLEAEWRNNAGSIISATQLINASPAAATDTRLSDVVVMPAGAETGTFHIKQVGGAGGTNTVYVSGVNIKPAATDDKLAPITDASKIQLHTALGDPRGIYESDGTLRGEEYYDSSIITYKSINTGAGDVTVLLESSFGASIAIGDSITIAPGAYIYLGATGNRTMQITPNSAPTDGDIPTGAVTFYLDQTNNKLKVRVKYSDGTLKTGEIALT